MMLLKNLKILKTLSILGAQEVVRWKNWKQLRVVIKNLKSILLMEIWKQLQMDTNEEKIIKVRLPFDEVVSILNQY